MNKFGFAGGSSQAHVEAAVIAFRKFENLMVGLTEEEREQVLEAAPVCNICMRPHFPWEETW